MLPQKLCTFARICCSHVLRWWKKRLPAVDGRCFSMKPLALCSIGHVSVCLPAGGRPSVPVPVGLSHGPLQRGQGGECSRSGHCWWALGFSRHSKTWLSLPAGVVLNCRSKSLSWQQQTTLDYMTWEQETCFCLGGRPFNSSASDYSFTVFWISNIWFLSCWIKTQVFGEGGRAVFCECQFCFLFVFLASQTW